MKTRVLPYKAGSVSAKAIANSLNVKRISLSSSRIRKVYDLLVINWGNSANVPSNLSGALFLNTPTAVAKASNKLEAFRHMEERGTSIPPYTTSRNEVRSWLIDGHAVVVRACLQGNSGEGITIIKGSEAEIPEAPLYTKYIKKSSEYRIHVGIDPTTGTMAYIDAQKKRRTFSVPDEEVNWQVRNRNNGFIFSREGVSLPHDALEEAIKAVGALGLHFGAVDIGFNEHNNSSVVYEVNTACGVEGTTLERYTNYFSRWLTNTEEALNEQPPEEEARSRAA